MADKDEKGDAGDDKNEVSIETVDNHIYFYSSINNESILKLTQQVKKLTNQLEATVVGWDVDKPSIYLHIYSMGGSIYAGFAGLDLIRRNYLPITTVVEGGCASAATFLSIAGARRLMGHHSFMLIHQLSASMWGKYSEFKDKSLNLDRFMEQIKAIYTQYTTIPEEKLDGILEHDIWFSKEECLEFGLVDDYV